MSLGVKKRIKEGESEKQPTRYFSSKQEKNIAEAVKGKRTPNSGASSIKGDVLTNGGSYDSSFLLEAKTKITNSESITIKREWFEKNRYEASEMGKAHTALVINFGPDEPYNENHYIIDEYLFKTLLEYLEQKNS